tara:strand:- start:880 stop:1347 length:468 start_codon:yes stop_codon:yes gene_type:complete
MTDYLTRVHLHFGRHNFNYYVRFGTPKYRDEVTGREAYEYYSKGSIFGYIRWEAGEHGTKSWRFFVLRGGDPNTAVCNIPGITPGAEMLLDVSGQGRVQRLFIAIDRIEQSELDCADVADWYWIQTNARINAGLEPLNYTADQHRSWLLERRVAG